jgi:hypothetical protein
LVGWWVGWLALSLAPFSYPDGFAAILAIRVHVPRVVGGQQAGLAVGVVGVVIKVVFLHNILWGLLAAAERAAAAGKVHLVCVCV